MSENNEDISPVKNDFLEQEQDGGKEVDSEPLGNPTPPPDVDLDKLRGDRIGDTVYSGKWCIQTVMKLMQSKVIIKSESTEGVEEKTDVVDMEEELQNEVGALWDMTINVDVCLYLHSVGAIESICYIITNSRCPRATEMCVGMLANIITHGELWKLLSGESTIFNILINLLTNIDQPILLEVARFFTTALCQTDNKQCYTCLCESSPLVTQELMRILSGSTNADLLKQAAELTLSLMSLDEKDACFGALFADFDFVSSVVEASKELGYEHETCGQNYIMEVFHYFTTYEAGVLAIENIMEQIAEASIHYLKTLCQSLNLSNNTNVITTIIATLNHIFCRHMMVRIGLMSSPSFIHTVLKTLVAVYRKLGFYNSIAYPKGRSTSQSTKTRSTWKMEEDFSVQNKAADTDSWSERANVALSRSTTFRTPDDSPSQVQESKELEVSWSERRMSSPLVEDVSQQKWKQPKQKKRLKKRESTIESDKYESESTIESDKYKKESNKEVNMSENTVQGDAANSEREAGNNLPLEASLASDEQTERLDLQKDEESNTCALKIGHGDSLNDLDSLRKSGEFTPQECEEMGSEGEDGEWPSGKHDESAGESIITGKSDIPSSLVHMDNAAHHKTSSLIALDDTHSKDINTVMPCDLKMSLEAAYMDNKDNVDSNKDNDYGFNDDDDDNVLGSSDGLNGNKYHKLLSVITEFLTDYFNNLRETLTREDGTPCIEAVMVYFNTQCSSVEIRAIAKCVGTGTKITQPLGRLLHMCDYFKAKHMKSLIIDFINKDT